LSASQADLSCFIRHRRSTTYGYANSALQAAMLIERYTFPKHSPKTSMLKILPHPAVPMTAESICRVTPVEWKHGWEGLESFNNYILCRSTDVPRISTWRRYVRDTLRTSSRRTAESSATHCGDVRGALRTYPLHGMLQGRFYHPFFTIKFRPS